MSLSRKRSATSELDWLIEAARSGSSAALGKLLESCRDYLLLVANRELGRDLRGKVGASDLVQDTFIHAQQRFADFQGTSETELLAWLRRMLLNQVFGVRRHYSGTIQRDISREVSWNNDSAVQKAIESLPCPQAAPGHGMSAEEDALLLRGALKSLPADYRQVITLRYWEELTFEEIGQRMGRSGEAARKLWLRAVEQLEFEGSWQRGEP